jgi:hypothetical protein
MRAHVVERRDSVWHAHEEETSRGMIRRHIGGWEVVRFAQVELAAECPGYHIRMCEAQPDIK